MDKSRKQLIYKPIQIIISYIFVTLILTFIGPVRYKNYSYGTMIMYLIFIVIAIYAGYISVSSKYEHKLKQLQIINNHKIVRINNYDKIIVFSIYIAFAFEILTFISYLNANRGINIQILFQRIGSIGDVYSSSLIAAGEVTEVNKLRQFITLFGLFKQISIIGYLLRKNSLKKYKLLFWGTILINIINALAFKGTQKEIGDLLIYFSSIWIINKATTGKIKIYKIVIPVTIISLAVFGFVQLSRAETFHMDMLSYETAFYAYNSNHIIYKLFGQKMGFAISTITYYISGGYYGLSKSLMVPFQWTFGLGNSFALSSYAAQYLGIDDMIINSIPFRAEAFTGYPALMYWSTIFPWLASDLSFPGCIIFMYFISRLYAITWLETIYNNNFLSALLFCRLNIMWMFLPANNQLMQTRESTIATILLLSLWFLFHKKLNNGDIKERKDKSYETIIGY